MKEIKSKKNWKKSAKEEIVHFRKIDITDVKL